MPNKWKIRGEAFTNATVRAGIGSAAALAAHTGISRGTAERVMRGEVVSRATVAAIVPKLDRDASELFEVSA